MPARGLQGVRVLLVDDDETVRDTFARLLQASNIEVQSVPGGRQALDLLDRDPDFDVLMTDLKMPEMSGLTLIERANALVPEMAKILVTGFGTREDAVAALRLGVHDFISKPIDDHQRLTGAVLRAAEVTRLRRENTRQRQALEQKTEELEATVRELRHANRVIRRHTHQLERDLATAARIQRHLLPQTLPPAPGFTFAARFLPSERVSGDFYQVTPLDPGHVLLAVADVAGHGVPAAMLSVLLSQSIESALAETLSAEGASPAAILEWLNRDINVRHNEQTPFVTMLCGVLDLGSGWVTLACAGHDAPLLQRRISGRVEPIDVHGVGLGLLPNSTYSETLVDLSPGDRLLLFTDGVTEAMSPSHELFGEERLTRTFAQAPAAPETALEHLLAAVTRHAGRTEQEDDICLLMIQRDLTQSKIA